MDPPKAGLAKVVEPIFTFAVWVSAQDTKLAIECPYGKNQGDPNVRAIPRAANKIVGLSEEQRQMWTNWGLRTPHLPGRSALEAHGGLNYTPLPARVNG